MKTVLIIDDEINIQKNVAELLKQNGFKPVECVNPEMYGKYLKNYNPDLVLLDIWMPGLDGHFILSEIKTRTPELPVIIISGHANVAASTRLIKQGADDIVEKPFSTERLFQSIKSVLNDSGAGDTAYDDSYITHPFIRKSRINQATIKKSCVLKGKGLHTGSQTGIILAPLPENSGIVFEDINTNTVINGVLSNIDSTSFSTNLVRSGVSIRCVEHLMASFSAYGISNVSVKVNTEVPIIDGSALPFVNLIEENGMKSQEDFLNEYTVRKSVIYTDPKDSDKYIKIDPYDGFVVDYFLELPQKIGNKRVAFDLSDNPHEIFKDEIAAARTFGFLNELKGLQAIGLGQGGDMENFIMLDDEKALNDDLRYPDEPARHKVLDIIGDFALLGCRIKGKITAHKTGHRHNIALLRLLLDQKESVKGEV